MSLYCFPSTENDGGRSVYMHAPPLVGCALANLLTLYMFVVVVIVDVTAVVLGGKVVD